MDIVRTINALRELNQEVEIHWIPAHEGFEGNERADREAKRATGWRDRRYRGQVKEFDTPHTAPPARCTRRLITTVKRLIKDTANKEWAEDWNQCTKGRDLRTIQPIPTKQVLKIHKGRLRAMGSLIIQMRTEKIGLKRFLYHRKVPGTLSDRCECGYAAQTARHVLCACRKYSQQRWSTWARERMESEHHDVRYTDMLTKYAGKAACFMRKSGLLQQFKALNEDQHIWT